MSLLNIKDIVDAYTTRVNNQDLNLAEDINTGRNAIKALAYTTLSQAGFANAETLSANKTLTDSDASVQMLNPNGADRDVSLAVLAETNHPTLISNTNGSNYLLNVKNSGGTLIRIVPPGKSFLFYSDGTQWKIDGFDLYETISPAQITANQNNYNPTGAYQADIIRLDADGAYNITGLAGGSSGRIKFLMNVSSETLTLTDEDANSSAANRFAFGENFEFTSNKMILLVYDGESERWRMVGGGGSSPSPAKGRVIFHTSHAPNTLGAGVNSLAGGSTPTEQYLHYVFPNSADSYREWLCSLQGYNGGGLTFKFLVLRSSAGAGSTYIFDLAIRRINTGSEELGASHSYAYNSVTVTIPAGPPAATIPMLATITFTHGADMDDLADGEFFVLRLRRDVDDTATDSCLVLAGMIGIET